MQARFILPLIMAAALFTTTTANAKTDNAETRRTTTITDSRGRTEAKTSTTGNTTWIKDAQGRTTGKIISQPSGGSRVTDPQGRTLYKVKQN